MASANSSGPRRNRSDPRATERRIPSAHGCFYGLTMSHGPSHLARAMLEGCAFAMRGVIDRLRAMGVAAETILLLGGGARSALWAQIRAHAAGVPVVVPRETDSSALGAAMLAGVAAKSFARLGEAAALLGGGGRRYEPTAERRVAYDDAYAAYRRLFQSLTPMFGPPDKVGEARP